MKGIRSQHAAKEQESIEWNPTPNIPRGKGPKVLHASTPHEGNPSAGRFESHTVPGRGLA